MRMAEKGVPGLWPWINFRDIKQLLFNSVTVF